MRTVSFLYKDEVSLKALIEEQALDCTVPYLIRIYTAIASRKEAAQLARTLQAQFPQAQIIGCSASGVIFQDQQYSDQTLVLIDDYEKAHFQTAFFTWKNKSAAEIGRELAAFANRAEAQLMHVLCSDHYYDIHACIEAFNHSNSSTKLVGGIAGDILPLNVTSYVFNGSGVLDQAIVAAAIGGSALTVYNEVNISHEPVSEKYRLTGCDGSYWDSVDGIPAEAWLREQLGIEQAAGYSSWQEIAENDEIVRFPMILENHHGASRMLKYDASAGRISQNFSQIPVNTEFRIGYTSPTACIQRCYEICSTISDIPIENLFVYDCLFRRLYLHNCAEWELSPFCGYGVCGAFILGEISNLNGVNEFLNGACCLVGTAENQVYLRPDSRVFDDLGEIADDTQDLLNYVLKKQREAVTRKNEYLMGELLKKQQGFQEKLMVDVHTGLGNYIKYKEENKLRSYDKLVMIQVENAEAIRSQLGQDQYLALLGQAADQIQTFLRTLVQDQGLTSYLLNEETLFAAAGPAMSEDQFLSLVHALFDKFQFIKIHDIQKTVLCRFVVVLHQQDMVERALNTLHANRHRQTSFLICDHEADEPLSSIEEFKIIDVLTRALENDGVVPYFQGIWDNQTQSISHYEALMRIIDVDGTVYAPAFFMDTAKKYHLYSYLSERMYERVFSLFAGRGESVSLNFSAYDINSQKMQQLIFEQLEKAAHPEHFILEILEDEPFRDVETLRRFIHKIRQYGVQIAIDDFGSGYSNFLQLMELNPDYLKIDGEIIRHLHQSETHRKLLRAITVLGREFNMKIVAEFVENKAIQSHILDYGIQYSQGFYFYKPAGFDQLALSGIDAAAQQGGSRDVSL